MDSELIQKYSDPKSFRFQFITIFLSFFILYNVSSTVNCATVSVGYSIILLISSWHITKWIRNRFFQETLSPGNKAVLVTGCDSGFGHLLAKRLGRNGYTVFAACLDPKGPGPQELLKTSPRIQVLAMDVTNDSHVKQVLQEVSSYLSKNKLELWSVVNNAGIATLAHVEWGAFADYQKVFEVNVVGLARVTRAFLPLLRRSKGRVVNVGSLAGRIASPGMAIYAMSKHAVVAFSTALRREMKPWGVHVALIEPSGYKTAMTDPAVFERDSKKLWEETNAQVREDYGEKCFEHTLKFLEMNDHSRDPEEVVDALMHAITAKEPEIAYGVYGWDKGRARFLSDYLPMSIFDELIRKRVPPIPEQK